MAHKLGIGDPGHPDHHTTCDMCVEVPRHTPIRIEPITPEEARDSRTYFPPHVEGMTERPGMDILRERMDAVLGAVIALDSGADSPFPDGSEWSWQVEPGALPRLVLSVDTEHAPVIRKRINDILRALGLQQC